jgi:hypothetical protein
MSVPAPHWAGALSPAVAAYLRADDAAAEAELQGRLCPADYEQRQYAQSAREEAQRLRQALTEAELVEMHEALGARCLELEAQLRAQQEGT